MSGRGHSGPAGDVREARRLFAATDTAAYFNTAAVGLASRTTIDALHRCVDEWAENGFDYGRGEASAVYARNRELAEHLRASLAEAGWKPVDLPDANRSTIVSVPLGDAEPTRLLVALKARGVVAAARDGNLRLSVHFYNHEDDVERVARALAEL